MSVQMIAGKNYTETKTDLEEAITAVQEGELKGQVFNTVVGAGADIFTTALTPTNSPTTFRIYAAFNGAAVLSVTRTRSGATVTEQLNAGAALAANCAYAFDIIVTTGDSINLQYAGAHTALAIKVVEIVGVPS
jgi:hypothetical protein